MATTLYRQCYMQREYTPGFFSHMVSFIPATFAIKGRTLELKNHSGEWENGWKVLGVGTSKTAEEVNDMHKDAKRIVEKDDHGRLRGK